MDDFESLSIEELEQKRLELFDEIGNRHTCAESSSIRLRIFNGGSVHHVMQCLVCGFQLGGPLSKSKANERLAGATALSFDTTIEPKYNQVRTALSTRFGLLVSELGKRMDPIGSIQSAQEIETARKNKDRAINSLEAALKEVAGAFLWREITPLVVRHTNDLVKKTKEVRKPFERFTSEEELKAWLEQWLACDFEFKREVPGVHLTEWVKVKIDYVLRPKPHLVEAGFKPGPIGIEVKYLPQEGSFASRASRFVWQAISYTDCQFQLPEGPSQLSRILLFSNMSFEDEYGLLKDIAPNIYENEKAKWTALLELANHANVGSLMMIGSRVNRLGWRIKFATGTYFSHFREIYSLHDANLFQKIRIGNF